MKPEDCLVYFEQALSILNRNATLENIRKLVKEEREACVKLAEDLCRPLTEEGRKVLERTYGDVIAEHIRKRGEQ